MSNRRYIEIDSTFRDRNRWPNPANFEIPISQTGRKSRFDALDPVSLAAPHKVWTSNLFNLSLPGLDFITVTIDSIVNPNYIAGTTTQSTLIITASPGGSLQQSEDYYLKAVAENTTISELRRIISYKYLGTNSLGDDRAQITLNTAFSNSLSLGDSITIRDPTDISNTTVPLFFIPCGREGQNAYIDCVLYNETKNESRQVIEYDTITHILKVDTSSAPVTGWLTTDSYNLRKEVPLKVGTVGVGPSVNTIPLVGSFSNVDDIYNRYYLRLTSGPAQNEIRMILDYDGATQTAIVTPNFSISPTVGNTIELLPFSFDNFNPLSYSGSLVSQQEEVCYQIELINLILPNRVLSVGSGSRIAFYPYIYVELSSVSGPSSGVKNILYSNNPNSTRMLFRAAVDDIPNPVFSSFVKIDGDGAVQTIKFKPNDTLKFSVRLSNGQIFDTLIQEQFSPYLPVVDKQISALFSIRRL